MKTYLKFFEHFAVVAYESSGIIICVCFCCNFPDLLLCSDSIVTRKNTFIFCNYNAGTVEIPCVVNAVTHKANKKCHKKTQMN